MSYLFICSLIQCKAPIIITVLVRANCNQMGYFKVLARGKYLYLYYLLLFLLLLVVSLSTFYIYELDNLFIYGYYFF